MSHWLEDGIIDALKTIDVEDALQAQVRHFARKGEWQKGVISPSLVGTDCRLSRVKIFLGHTPIPFQDQAHMATRAGRPDAGSLLNMVRGFDVEGLMLEAIRLAFPEHLVQTAPTFQVDWFDGENGYRYAGHPDALMRHPDPDIGLAFVQIKSPSVFKMDRVEKKGPMDALESYLPQMATELYIGRRAGLRVNQNILLLSNWENTPKSAKPRIKAIELDWDDSLATIPETAADQIHEDAARALMSNIWPQALPKTSWDVWPCSYCRFSRLEDFEIPACDNHEKWRINDVRQPDTAQPGGSAQAQ